MKHQISCFPVSIIYARMLTAAILACWWLQNIRFILLSILVELISAAVIRWQVQLRLVVMSSVLQVGQKQYVWTENDVALDEMTRGQSYSNPSPDDMQVCGKKTQ